MVVSNNAQDCPSEYLQSNLESMREDLHAIDYQLIFAKCLMAAPQ